MSQVRPITLLTGFLGAGKTTLVNRLLADPGHAQTAVIVNELSDTGIDRSLIAAVKGQVIEMTTGCLCCAAGGDVTHALIDLAKRAEHYEITPFARVVIETTGLADPTPLLPQLMLDARLVEHYRLTSIITVVDAVQGDTHLDRYGEAEAQVKVADTVLLTKSDLATDPVSKRDVEKLIGRLAALNASAAIADVHDPATDLPAIFARQPLSPRAAGAQDWLGARARPIEVGSTGTRRIPSKHTPGVRAFAFIAAGSAAGARDRRGNRHIAPRGLAPHPAHQRPYRDARDARSAARRACRRPVFERARAPRPMARGGTPLGSRRHRPGPRRGRDPRKAGAPLARGRGGRMTTHAHSHDHDTRMVRTITIITATLMPHRPAPARRLFSLRACSASASPTAWRSRAGSCSSSGR